MATRLSKTCEACERFKPCSSAIACKKTPLAMAFAPAFIAFIAFIDFMGAMMLQDASHKTRTEGVLY